MAVHCIVPARLGSSRFPGKPLVRLCGKEMIVRTMERAREAACFDRLVCATDTPEIARVVEASGFEAVMTGPASTGSDRVAEAARRLGLDLVVNLQGDEPLVEPSILREVATTLGEHPEGWVTVACPLLPSDRQVKTVVKVKVEGDFAVDFTRILPDDADGTWFQHQGIYAYSAEARNEFASLPQNAVELERSLEQMRILGLRPIRMVKSPFPSISVDVESDARMVERLLNQTEKDKRDSYAQ